MKPRQWLIMLAALLSLLLAACGANAENTAAERVLPDAVTDEGAPSMTPTPDAAVDDTPAAEATTEAPADTTEPQADDPETPTSVPDTPATPSPESPTSESPTSAPTQPPAPPPTVPVNDDVRCIVQLHGKGGKGGDTQIRDDGIVVPWPDGNGTGWGGLQWEYDTDAALQEATGLIVASMDSAECGRTVIHGFSNGASMTAALYCSGNDLGGRLVGVIVDDPVTDAGTIGCSPATSQVVLYWTGALERPVGTQCARIDWTCAGGELRGVAAYAADLGIEATQSPQSQHRWNFDTPFPVMWLE